MSLTTRSVIHLMISLVILLSCEAEKESYSTDGRYAQRALKSVRETFRTKLIEETIEKTIRYKDPIDSAKAWQGAFWAMGLTQYRSSEILERLQEVASDLSSYPADFQRGFLETVYGLYPDGFEQPLVKYLYESENPKLFAMAAYYLLRSTHDEIRQPLILILNQRFPGWGSHPILLGLKDSHTTRHPPLQALLRHDFGKKNTVIYSFHRKDRRYPGLTIVRKPDGTFVREDTGNIFFIPHLAASVSGLPGTITNGNSPQGIYSLQGTDVSENVFIGPTPNIQMRLPFEADVRTFFHDRNTTFSDSVWSIERYKKLLPDSWKNWPAVYEAYHAGKAGRSEIIAHGTTINPDYYTALPCYPFTPSLGCLTALELWSPLNGRLEYSGQVRLLNAYHSAGQEKGYFILVEIDDKEAPVSIAELLEAVLSGEEELRQFSAAH